MKLIKSFLYIFILSFAGCNYSKIKNASADESSKFSLPADKISELSYTVLAQKVFTPKCISCHGNSGNINLESYNQVTQNLPLIKNVVFETQSMPKNNTLADDELSYLWNWIKIGAPELAQNNPQDPENDVLISTYESINKHVFQISCKECHNPSGTAKRVPLDKTSLLNSPRELVLPGNPDESGLVLAVERTDENRMPPASEGYSELSDEAKNVIRDWIKNGAAD